MFEIFLIFTDLLAGQPQCYVVAHDDRTSYSRVIVVGGWNDSDDKTLRFFSESPDNIF